MYHFAIGEKEYRARFQYEHVNGFIKGKESDLEYKAITKCFIEMKDGTKVIEINELQRVVPVWIKMLTSEAYCSVKDQFSKELGRKAALDRATQDLGPTFRGAAFGAMFKGKQ